MTIQGPKCGILTHSNRVPIIQAKPTFNPLLPVKLRVRVRVSRPSGVGTLFFLADEIGLRRT
jgi:hypothetical protein